MRDRAGIGSDFIVFHRDCPEAIVSLKFQISEEVGPGGGGSSPNFATSPSTFSFNPRFTISYDPV